MPARRLLAVVVTLALVGLGSRPAAAAKASQILKLLPEDVTMIAVANVKASRRAKLFGTISGPVLTRAHALVDRLTAAGIDPIKSVSQVILAASGELSGFDSAASLSFVLAIAEGKFPADLLSRDARATRATFDGVATYTLDGYESALIARRLYTTRAGDLSRVIAVVKGKAKSAATSRRGSLLRAAVAGTDTTEDYWAVARVSGFLASALGFVDLEARWISAAGSIGTELGLGVRLGLKSAAIATERAAAASAALPELRQTLTSAGLADAAEALSVGSEDEVLRVATSLTAGELAAVAKLAGWGAP